MVINSLWAYTCDFEHENELPNQLAQACQDTGIMSEEPLWVSNGNLLQSYACRISINLSCLNLCSLSLFLALSFVSIVL